MPKRKNNATGDGGECIKSGRRKVLQQQGEGSKVSFMSEEAKRKYLANIHKL